MLPPTQINSGLCPTTIGTICCCLWAPPRQPRFVGRRSATPALTAALQAALLRCMFPLLLCIVVKNCLSYTGFIVVLASAGHSLMTISIPGRSHMRSQFTDQWHFSHRRPQFTDHQRRSNRCNWLFGSSKNI